MPDQLVDVGIPHIPMYCKQHDAWTRMGLKYGLLHAYTLLSVKTSGQAVKLQNKALSKTFPSASIIR